MSIGKIAVVTAATEEDIIDSFHSKAAEPQRRIEPKWAVNPNIQMQFMLQPPTEWQMAALSEQAGR